MVKTSALPTAGGPLTITGAFFQNDPTINQLSEVVALGTATPIFLVTATQMNTDSTAIFNISYPDLHPVGINCLQGLSNSAEFYPDGDYGQNTQWAKRKNLFTFNIQLININGNNFGCDISKVVVKLNKISLPIVKLVDHYTIQVSLPNATSNYFDATALSMPGNKSLTMTISGLGGNMVAQKLTIMPFTISVTRVSMIMGGRVTIIGSNLSTRNVDNSTVAYTIMMGSLTCAVDPLMEVVSNQLTCIMPSATYAQAEQYMPVVVTINGVSSIGNIAFSYIQPSLTFQPFQFGQQIVISGKDMGTLDTMQVEFNGVNSTFSTTLQRDDGTQIMLLPVPALVPLGEPKPLNTMNNGQSIVEAEISIREMNITLSNTTMPVTGGLVIITGAPVGLFKPMIINDIGVPQCKSIEWIEDPPKISCQLQGGSGLNMPLTVTLYNVTALTTTFSYLSPVLYSASSIGQNGGVITIIGDNFAQVNDLAVVIGGITCKNVQVTDEHTITCSIHKQDLPSTLPTGEQVVKVTMGQQDVLAALFTFTQPPPTTTSTTSTTSSTTTTGNPSSADRLVNSIMFTIVISLIISMMLL
ncbi:hypothetical protein SAMD00019534_072280 [Acytostelium subglobosum LB1]|uniref:hypothetical protein n=1 Tax=Acytostelium subglobosum LB1 TaxID=1410327 RepID=UPI000644FFF8|nr:hypothetical protein SAMD00019534_072280 [Acytostelium subglobosum LB1]GAM24053.1 hypothetical protein SAMD00019534_072280 [Acytostelium subglobosum LB1]|eukprot:XP_012753089.1 hypothetical protein SAMD00019534_072280 [Acytostelium subglobosum LB1]